MRHRGSAALVLLCALLPAASPSGAVAQSKPAAAAKSTPSQPASAGTGTQSQLAAAGTGAQSQLTAASAAAKSKPAGTKSPALSRPADADDDDNACPAIKGPPKPPAKAYEDALAEYKKRQYAAAYCGLLDAQQRGAAAQIIGDLGRVEIHLGKYPEAAEHLSAFLRGELSADDRAAAEHLLSEAKAMVGTLRIEVVQRGAEVFVDGARIGTAPLANEVFVSPGKRAIEARLKGAVGLRTISVGVGSVLSVTLDATPPPPPKATSAASAAPAISSVVSAVSTLVHDAAPPAWTPTRKAAVAGAFGLGAAAIGIGVGAAVASFNKQNDVAWCRMNRDIEGRRAAEQDQVNWARASAAGFVVGSLAVAAGIVAVITWPSDKAASSGPSAPAAPSKSPPSPGVTAGVRAGADGGGFILSGSW